ncbi:MAG: PAS domain S-box protein [Rhodospirillales bacterium]|nr:PAS domain S-box protein [Rhodospirillales bacterium]
MPVISNFRPEVGRGPNGAPVCVPPALQRDATTSPSASSFRSKGTVAIRRSSSGRWLEWVEKALPSGSTVGLRVDVTELKQATEAAERARAEYAGLVDSLSDAVYKVDLERGTITFLSAAAAELYGISSAALIGTPFLDHVVPEHHQRLKDAVRRGGCAADGVCEVQFTIRRADGTLRQVEARFRRTVEAGTDMIAGVVRDVTERARLAARLEQETGRLRAIVESSGALVMLTDAELNVIMVNREFEQFWGVSAAHMIGRRLEETDTDTGPGQALWRQWLVDRPGQPARFVRRTVDGHGRQRVLNVTASPVADEAGIVRQIVFLGVDDTERAEAEQTMFHNERLSMVGEMAATVAHDVAQPLEVINLARTTALEEVTQAADTGSAIDTAYLVERLDRIGQQVERASRILGDLRSFVRGERPDDAAPFDPAAAVRGAVDLTDHVLKTDAFACR